MEIFFVFGLVASCNTVGSFCAEAAPDKDVPANALLFLNGHVKECALHCGDVMGLVDCSEVDERQVGKPEFNNVHYRLVDHCGMWAVVLAGVVEGFKFAGALFLHSWVGAAEDVA